MVADSRGENSFRFLGWITAAVITFQLVSDATAAKTISLFGLTVSVTVLYFPVTYILSDVLTEVYGYSRARSVIWKSLFASIAAGLLYQLALAWPGSASFTAQEGYKQVFGVIPRILIGGWLAVFAGEIINNYIMARMKVFTQGRNLWLRAVSSTLAGQFANTAIFYVVALGGVLPQSVLVEAIIAGWLIKSAVEAALLPLTYLTCDALKRAEGVDIFDEGTNFNPFIISK